MSESHILDQIRKLVKLQEGDTDFYNVRRELEEKPVLLQQLAQAFEEKKVRLKQLEEDFKKIQVERHSLEGDLAQKEQAIQKSESQLSQIKTNKEYTAKIGEIEGLKADKSVIEEKILESYDKTDDVKVLIANERARLATDEAEFSEKKSAIESEMSVLNEKIQQMSAARAVLLEGVDKALLRQYERILDSREGIAVVPVFGSSCGGCFMKVPQQTINEIRKRKEIVICDICTRILYLEEDLASENT